MSLRPLLAIAITAFATPVLSAQATQQSPSAPSRSAIADSITATEIARYVGVIAHDSMLGRDTPSRGLEQTAQYVAAQFQALGLEPIDGSGSFVQRYPVPGHAALDTANWVSHFWFAGIPKKTGKSVVEETGDSVMVRSLIDFGAAVIVASDTVSDSWPFGDRDGGFGSVIIGDYVGPPPVVVAGPHTFESVRRANLRDTTVIYIPASRTDSVLQRRIVEQLQVANNVIVVADEDSASFAARRARMHPPVVLEWFLPQAQHYRRSVLYVGAVRPMAAALDAIAGNSFPTGEQMFCSATVDDCDHGGNMLLTRQTFKTARYFPVPGIYEYRSVRKGLQGRITVVDER